MMGIGSRANLHTGCCAAALLWCLAVVLSATNSLWIWGTAQKNAALQR
jgi:hypothetical protein